MPQPSTIQNIASTTSPHTSPVPNVLFRRLRDALQSVFWLVPAVVIQMDGFSDRTVILGATTTGLLWQLVYRRDLADRLVVLAMSWIVLSSSFHSD